MEYKKYYRKTSLKQKGVSSFFLDEVSKKKPKTFLEIGVFHGVTGRNVCELLYKIHGNNFNYVGLDLFEESDENKDEVISGSKQLDGCWIALVDKKDRELEIQNLIKSGSKIIEVSENKTDLIDWVVSKSDRKDEV